MIYLASPYSHPNLGVVIDRYNKTLEVVGRLMLEGLPIFSPIVHCHEIATRTNMPKDFEYWQEYNKHMLLLAEELWVLRLEDWEKSRGVKAEIEFALANTNMEVVYIDG